MILLIEDHQPTALALQRLLRIAGYQSTIVTTLAAARAVMALPNHLQLIISDVHLPDGNAIDLIRERKNKSCPAIAVTGSLHTRDEIDQCLSAGFALCLRKPIEFDELVRAIKRVHQIDDLAPDSAPKNGDPQQPSRPAAR